MSIIDDLSPEQIEQIEKYMQKGEFSVSGFLNSGERLKNVIERDEQTLQRFGVTHKQVADRLESILRKAERLEQLGPAAIVEDLFVVLVAGSFGIQQCPFLNPNGEPCWNYTSYDYSIENMENGITIRFSGLIMHLVRDHHFFEGSVYYRLEPEQVIKALEIQPGQDYSMALEGVFTSHNKASSETFKPLDQEAQMALNEPASSKNICPKCGYQNPLYRAKCKNCDEPLLKAPHNE